MGFPSTKMLNAAAPGLHDPSLLKSHSRRSRQLGFEIDETAVHHARPVTVLERRTRDIQALLAHVRVHPALWEEVERTPSVVTSDEASKEAGEDEAHLSDLFTTLAERARFALDGYEVQAQNHVISGLEFLAAVLSRSILDATKFRVLWLALWPLISDFGLLTEASLQDRVAIQKVLAKGF